MYDRSRSTGTSEGSSIDVWLDGLLETQEFESPNPQKRSKPRQKWVQYSRKRRYLGEITGNSMSPRKNTSPARRGRTPAVGSKAPIRSKNIQTSIDDLEEDKEEEEQEEQDEDTISRYDNGQDPEQTPRAGPRVGALNNAPSLRQRPPPSLEFGSPRSKSHSSNSSNRSSRSGSPTKKMGDLQFADMPVVLTPWSGLSAEAPHDLQGLIRDLQPIVRGKRVIPQLFKDELAAAGEYTEDVVCVDESKEDITGGRGMDIFRYNVGDIYQASYDCTKENDPEASWNSEVHSRVLNLALRGYQSTPGVWYRNITSARISDSSLLPYDIGKGAMQSKLVDYAIVINSSEVVVGEWTLNDHIVEKLRSEKTRGINQTSAEWIRFKPIAINIETKKGAVDDDRTHVQLSTWLIAQYKRLRQLTNESVKVPSLPVLSVRGGQWSLLIASLRKNGRIYLLEGLVLGDTGSVFGVYQVIAAIRRLARWVNEEYRPWFEREVLGMTGPAFEGDPRA